MDPKSVQRSSTPTGVQAAALSSDSVRVWWSANPEAVAAYVVQRDGYGWYWDADRRQSAYGRHFVTLCRSATTTCDVGNLSRGRRLPSTWPLRTLTAGFRGEPGSR